MFWFLLTYKSRAATWKYHSIRIKKNWTTLWFLGWTTKRIALKEYFSGREDFLLQELEKQQSKNRQLSRQEHAELEVNLNSPEFQSARCYFW